MVVVVDIAVEFPALSLQILVELVQLGFLVLVMLHLSEKV